MTTKIPVELSSTPGIVDGSNATAITIDSSENVTLAGDLTLSSATANKPVLTLTDTNADSQGPDLVFRKDSSSPADNDELFRIYGYGDDDAGNATEGFLMLATMTDVSNGSEDTKVRIMTYGAGSQRDTLTLAGLNVGIGTTSPSETLHVKRADGTALIVESSNDQNNTGDRINIEFRTDGSQGIAKIIGGKEGNYQGTTVRSGYLAFQTLNANSYAERMRIESTGDVRFNIANAALTAGEVHTFNNAGRGNNLGLYTTGADQHYSIDMWNHTGGSCNQVLFRSGGNGTVVGSITSTGNNATQFNTSSDYRLKENVDYTWDATTRLKQLKPARFNFKNDADNTVDGFLAHEVSSIVPESITGTKDASETKTNCVLMAGGSVFADGVTEAEWIQGKTDGTYESNTTWVASKTEAVYQAIDQSKLVPLLVKTIQELEARITTLEGE